jgi:stage II sporulation protein D
LNRKKFDSFLNRILHFFLISSKTSKLILFQLLLVHLFLFSCSPAKRFTEKEQNPDKVETTEELNSSKESGSDLDYSEIRVSMQGLLPAESLLMGSSIELYDENKKIAFVKSGNTISCFYEDGQAKLVISDQSFIGEKFTLSSANNDDIIKLNGKRYRGKIKILVSGNSVSIINALSLEDYVKGVLAKEMPIGKGTENLEALKALAICVRTYAIQKMKDGKVYFDIYADTRDQVYGGVDDESPITNRATDETQNLILKYDGNPAIIFYHSTCGGYTESVENVFTKEPVPYLITVKDGDEPNCVISPRFNWEEKYTRELIVDRLKNYSLIENKNYSLEDISVTSRFNSGRVKELEINLVDDSGEEQLLVLRGNEIRSIIRNADGKSILWSNMFDVSTYSNFIILSGKGFGHGVGLCQWGAISLSKKGWSYEEILNHYYPGTNTEKINDKN